MTVRLGAALEELAATGEGSRQIADLSSIIIEHSTGENNIWASVKHRDLPRSTTDAGRSRRAPKFESRHGVKESSKNESNAEEMDNTCSLFFHHI